MAQHGDGSLPGPVRRAAASVEALQEHAVQAVLLHPAEVRPDRLLVVRTEEQGRGAVRVPESSRIGILIFRHVRPHVDVDPVLVRIHRPPPGLVEPALIAGHHQALVLRMDGLGAVAGVRGRPAFQARGRFPGQGQVPVGRDAVLQGDEGASGRRDGHFPGDLEDGRSLVDLVEHRDIQHLRAGFEAVIQLFPEETPPVAGNLDAAVVALHVVPGEARETERRIGNPVRIGPFHVLPDELMVLRVGSFIVSAHEPGHHDVALEDEVVQPLVGKRVRFQVPPMRRDPDHHAEAPFLEAVDDLFGFVEPVFPVVVEAHAPDGDQGLPVVVQVGRIVLVTEQVMPLRKLVDVLEENLRPVRRHPAQVIHHGHGAVVLVGAFHRGGKDRVEVVLARLPGDFSHEPLHEHAVQAVFLHPAEMDVHRALVIRRRDGSLRPVLEHERGLVQVGILIHLGPQVDGAPAGLETVSLLVMVPVPAGTVAGGGEPSLVARHHQTLVGVIGHRRPVRSLREGRDRGGQRQPNHQPFHFTPVCSTV